MRIHILFLVASGAAGLALLQPAAVHAAPPANKAGAKVSSAPTNAVPQSVFTLPASLKKGRDPFFPDATYWLGLPVAHKPSPTPHVDVSLVFNGVSGTPDHRLAMINGKTLAEGDATDIITSHGRVKVRCLQIKGDTVVVEVDGERRELHLRGD